MNIDLPLSLSELWEVAGWTMIHYLWIGAIVGVAGAAGRMALRRAAPGVRYLFVLACLAGLAALPVGIAGWLITHSPSLEGAASSAVRAAQHGMPRGGVVELKSLDDDAGSYETPASPAPGALAPGATDSSLAVASGEQPHALVNNTTISFAAIELLVSYLPWVWLVGTPITFALLAVGLVGTRRLRQGNRPVIDGPIVDALERLRRALGVTKRVTVVICERIAAPALVGIVRPMILLPPAALTGWSPEEIEMVLLHELAHVRRWDNLVNLAQRIVESLLFFHPVVWLVSNWVRREREACCDAIVVRRTNRPHAYAELLVALAAQMPRSVLFHPVATSAMAAGPLRARIRRILQLEDDPMLISGKSLVVTLGALLAIATLSILYVPQTGHAEPSNAKKKAANQDGEEDAVAGHKSSTAKTKKQPESVADGLDEYRKAVVVYDLDFNSVFPQRAFKASDEARLKRYASRDAWPDVLGHVDTDADKFRVVRERHDGSHEKVTGPNAFLLPLSWNIGTENYATLLFLKGVEQSAHVVAHSYTSLACFGPMAGDMLFKSYATAYIDGDMTGQISAESYFNLVVTGKCSGKIYTSSYAMLYLTSGFSGTLELENSKVYIGGRTLKSDLARIQGAGKVYLEESDLPAGEHSIGGLSVTVKKPTSLESIPAVTKDAKSDDVGVETVVGKAPNDDWPAGVVFPSPKEGEISKRAWQLLGIKVSPATADEERMHGRRLKAKLPVVGGPSLAFLQSVAGIDVNTFDELADVLDKVQNEDFAVVKCLVPSRDGNTWIEIAASPTHKLIPPEAYAPGGPKVVESSHPKFPSLEEQKLADLAYKRLGLELEPIGEHDLQRVKALGYDGGLTVTSGGAGDVSTRSSAVTIQPGDILVGLHVWPTTSMQALAEVLNRDDLVELNPLKFYVVRNDMVGGKPIEPVMGDVVRTGRVTVSVNHLVGGRGAIPFGGQASGRMSPGLPAQNVPYDPFGRASSYRTTQPATAPATRPRTSVELVNMTGKQLSVQSFEEILRRAEIFVVLFYTSDQPGDFTKFQTQIKELHEHFPIGAAAVEVHQQPEIAKRYDISRVPTYLVFQNGKKILSFAGRDTSAGAIASRVKELSALPSADDRYRSAISDLRDSGTLFEAPNLHDSGASGEPRPDADHAAPKPDSADDSATRSAASKTSFRYEGKTFHQWRNEWQTELSTEKRLEAIKALAAFGRVGYGKEAVQAILDVAGEYEFSVLGTDAPEDRLKNTVLSELAPENLAQSLVQFWLPDLAERVQKEPDKWKWLAYWLIGRLRNDEPSTIATLHTLASAGGELGESALGALLRITSGANKPLDEKTRKLVDEALQSKNPGVVISTLQALVYSANSGGGFGGERGSLTRPTLHYRPAMLGQLLFHNDANIRRGARRLLLFVDENDAKQIVDAPVAVLNDKSRPADHIEAIRALGALGPRAKKTLPQLIQILKDSDDESTLAAVVVAIIRTSGRPTTIEGGGGRRFHVDAIAETLNEHFSGAERETIGKKLGGGANAITQSLVERLLREDSEVLPPSDANMGGGGFF